MNTIEVQHLNDRLVLRFAPGQYAFNIAIVVIACVGLPYVALKGFPDPNGGWIYRYMQYATGAFAVLMCYILIRYLRGMPRIEIPQGSGEIQFFKYRRGNLDYAIPWSEVAGFKSTLESYLSDGTSYSQQVLYLVKKSGDPAPLCGSVDGKLIADLQAELESEFERRRSRNRKDGAGYSTAAMA